MKIKKSLVCTPLVGGNPFTTTSIYTLILFLEKNGVFTTQWEEQECS